MTRRLELGASRLPEELLGPIKATLNDPKRRMRVRITHGSQDAFYVVAQTRGFAQQLAEVAPAGAVEWNEHPFWGHGASNDDFEAAARWLVSSPPLCPKWKWLRRTTTPHHLLT